jgi:hypothetical protein
VVPALVFCQGRFLASGHAFWTPLYWLSAYAKLITAVISVATAVVVPMRFCRHSLLELAVERDCWYPGLDPLRNARAGTATDLQVVSLPGVEQKRDGLPLLASITGVSLVTSAWLLVATLNSRLVRQPNEQLPIPGWCH